MDTVLDAWREESGAFALDHRQGATTQHVSRPRADVCPSVRVDPAGSGTDLLGPIDQSQMQPTRVLEDVTMDVPCIPLVLPCAVGVLDRTVWLA